MGTPGSYTLQGLLGCELGPDNASVPVATFALNGEEFMKFDPKAGTWNGDWPEVQTISAKWMQHAETVNKEKAFLLYSCPQRLLDHLERGRGNLEWKGEQAPGEHWIPGDLLAPQAPLRPHPLTRASSLASQPPVSPQQPIPHSAPRGDPAPLLHMALPWLPETSEHSSSPSAGHWGPHMALPRPLS